MCIVQIRRTQEKTSHSFCCNMSPDDQELRPLATKSSSGSALSASKGTTVQPTFDPSKLPASRTGGTHCTPIDSNYGILGKDDTFAKDEKKGFGATWANKLKGKISPF